MVKADVPYILLACVISYVGSDMCIAMPLLGRLARTTLMCRNAAVGIRRWHPQWKDAKRSETAWQSCCLLITCKLQALYQLPGLAVREANPSSNRALPASSRN